MKYTLKDGTQLFDLAAEFSLKPAASVIAIVAAILQREADINSEKTVIKIDLALVSSAYGRVPATFAQALRRSHEIEYSQIQSYVRNENGRDYLYVIGGQEKHPTTFRARAMRALAKFGRFKIPKKETPSSYRKRPSILSAILTDELGVPVCNSCKGSFVIWKLDKSK